MKMKMRREKEITRVERLGQQPSEFVQRDAKPRGIGFLSGTYLAVAGLRRVN